MSSRKELATALRGLRMAAGISGAEAARRTGLSQARVSRMETGAYTPVVEAVEALCRLYKAPATKRKELVTLARELSKDDESAAAPRVVVHHSPWRIQQRIGKVEQESKVIRAFHPSMIIGLLQTTDYIRTIFEESYSEDETNRAVSARAKRQKLVKSQRKFTLLMAEGALRWQMGSPSIMVSQLDHLIGVTKQSNIRLGIIPWTTPSQIAPVHGFQIYDSRAVTTGLTSGQIIITNEREIVEYEELFSELEGIASFGDDARSVITRVIADFRSLL